MAQSLHDLCTEVISGQKDPGQRDLHLPASSESKTHTHRFTGMLRGREYRRAILGLLLLLMIHEMLRNKATRLLEKHHVESAHDALKSAYVWKVLGQSHSVAWLFSSQMKAKFTARRHAATPEIAPGFKSHHYSIRHLFIRTIQQDGLPWTRFPLKED